MSDDVKPEVIKKTQDILGKYFRKPPLTEKLLKKPPFRFLHDIVTAVIKETGFLEGLFSEEELNSENIKDKEGKLAFLTKLIEVVKIATGVNLTVRPSKIVSGQEPEKTNELLQTIGKAIEKKINTAEAIEQYKKGLEKRSKSAKSKSAVKEDSNKKSTRQSSQTRKPEKETVSSDHRKRSASTGKVTTKENDAHHESKEDKNAALDADTHEKDQRNKKGGDVIDVPPAEPLQDKRPPSSQRGKHSPTSKTKQNIPSPTALVESTRNKSSSAGHARDKKSEERSRRKDSARIKQTINEEIEPQANTNRASENSLPQEYKVINHVDEKTEQIGHKNDNKENTSRSVEQQQHGLEKLEHPAVEFLKNTPEVVETRPRTSLRPPTARPISARPAAPRMRAKTELIVNEEIPTPVGNINVIVENSDTKDDDDDADDMVVMETRGRSDSLENNSNFKLDSQLTQEHGHLVAQILETQRELVNTDNVDVLPKKVDIAWEAGSKRDREAMIKEIDKLRSTIQTLTRATNPLGKLLDYLQEDVEIMQKELLDWRNQYNQLSEQLEKEQMQTQELIEPMKETLKDIDNNMKDQLDKICQTKARIIKNDQKIQKLLSGYI